MKLWNASLLTGGICIIATTVAHPEGVILNTLSITIAFVLFYGIKYAKD